MCVSALKVTAFKWVDIKSGELFSHLIVGDLQKAKQLLAKMKYFANLEDKVKAKKVPP